MNRIILTLCITMNISGIFSQPTPPSGNPSYTHQWEQVHQFEKQSLPQSAARVVDAILKQALEDKNSPQIIKAVIHQGKYDLRMDTDNDTVIFQRLHQLIDQSDQPVEQAVLHSLLGELYWQYYQNDQWNIDQRTELGDVVPDDMNEWTPGIFQKKVIEHTLQSVNDPERLEKTLVETYADIVLMGKDSRTYFPTLYDFLTRRAIEILSQLTDKEMRDSLVTNLYDHHLASLKKRGLEESSLLVELERIDFSTNWGDQHQKSRSELERLLNQWEGKAMSVEIIDKLANLYDQENDEQKKELYELLRQYAARYPDYERIGILENRLNMLTQSEFTVTGNKIFHSEDTLQLKVTFKNLPSLSAKLYRVLDAKEIEKANRGMRNQLNLKFVADVSFNLPQTAPYLQRDTTVHLDQLEKGTYLLRFDPLSRTNPMLEHYFAVSDMAVFTRPATGDKYDFFAVDRKTGEPLPNASILIYKLPGNWRNSQLTEVASLPVDPSGMAVYHKDIPNNDVYYQVVTPTDRGSFLNRLPSAYWSFDNEVVSEREEVLLFTDRSLYRPEQIVYYKGIITRVQNNQSTVIPGKGMEVTLRDANGQEVSVQHVQTNEFGSVTGEFVLPTGLLPGSFSLVTEGGSTQFQVEEYKRPTFEITFDTVRQTYKFDQAVTLTGKAESYSGILLQEARVSYRVTRRHMRWWGWPGSAEQIDQGETYTNSEGVFELTFTPVKPHEGRFYPPIFSFTVEATVTDINGETQTGVYTLAVGDVSMILSLELSERMEKSSQEKVIISATNLNGSSITASGTYQLFSLLENDSIHQEVGHGDFLTGEQPELKKKLVALPSGKYRVELTSHDDQGNRVTAEQDILLFSYQDKRPPIKTNAWYLEKNTRFADGVPAEIILGSSEPIHVLYELWQGHTLLERKWIAINDENRLFSFPYQPEYAEGVTLRLTYVKEGQFYAHRSDLLPAKKGKKLTVSLDVFRDRIRPGTAEEWRISVVDSAGDPAAAEVLASMYDFSLDQIFPSRHWYIPNYTPERYRSNTAWQSDQSFTPSTTFGYASIDHETIPHWEFDQLNWFDFSLFYGRMLLRSAQDMMVQENMVMGYGQPKREVAQAAAAPSMAEEDSARDSATKESGTTGAAPNVRRNFRETAFFYPGLRTNEKGQTVIAFTVPESNTRWRFRVLAHDKMLNHGHAEAFTVSRKELMVTPNMPRFLRHGDHASIATKISNLSGNPVKGTVTLEFFDPVTEESIQNLSSTPNQPFSLAPGASTDAAWSFDVPDGIDLVGVRIIARTDQFSDGEQHALAVLPNRMLVTESMRMDVRPGETKTFTMGGLTGASSGTLENYRLTLEFTANPAWYAVQALPVLSEPTNDNAVSWFASYYAHTMGTHIAKTYPKVAAMVDLWQKQGGDAESLLSNLDKNQELKQVLLEETPWVLAARDESEQKQKLGLLFDLNRSSYQSRQALAKLTELQTNQGGWSWFKGFRPNVSITHYILYGFHQLKALEALEVTQEIASMQEDAVLFIDAEALRRFETLKKYNQAWKKMQQLPITDLEYLFVRTFYPQVDLDEEVQEMVDFYRSVAQTHWTRHGLYERSLIAMLMGQEGNTQTVQAILASLREHATRNPELGMYWANNRAHVFMSQSAVTVHTFIMAAFRAGGADTREMDEMKQWLLKQKQTQAWETTHATMDAVYTLLSTGSDWFSSSGKTELQVGRHTVEDATGEPGTGYIKTTWSGSDITPDMGTVRVTHHGKGPAWGALYRQYFEDLDKIEKSDGSLDIEKELYVEEMKPGGPELMRITEERPLKVGDKVTVRLVLRTDRDLEFVHLKDTRAAAFEPVDQVSGTGWQNGIIYYRTSKDASTNFYVDVLPRGTYVFEYSVRVNRVGRYSNGITTLQCLYAPEFTSHTAGISVHIRE